MFDKPFASDNDKVVIESPNIEIYEASWKEQPFMAYLLHGLFKNILNQKIALSYAAILATLGICDVGAENPLPLSMAFISIIVIVAMDKLIGGKTNGLQKDSRQ